MAASRGLLLLTEPRPASFTVDAQLAMAFVRLDLQAAIFLGRCAPAMNLGPVSASEGRGGFQDADMHLTLLLSRMFKFFRETADEFRYREPGSVPLHVLAEAHELEADFCRFHDAHLRPGTPLMQTGPRAETSVRVAYLTNVILLATSLMAEETVCDGFAADFLQITTLATRLVQSCEGANGHSPERTGFSLEMCVIHALYIVSAKCRDPLLRRRAIALLDAMPGAEGAWEARLYARIGERLMQLEERGPGSELPPPTPPRECSDGPWIPEWRRIHSAEIYQTDGWRARVRFRWRPNGMDGEWDDFEEMIPW